MRELNGFTLMELLVVVLLIAILAAMATPQYMKVVEKQKGTAAIDLLASIGKSEERYFSVNEAYTNDFSDLDTDLVDSSTKTTPNGPTYNTKYFYFQLHGTQDGTSNITATRRGNESYVLERNYTTGRICCGSDNTSGGDICDVLDVSNGIDKCESAPAEDSGNSTGGGSGTTPVTPTTPQNPTNTTTCSGTQPAQSENCTNCGIRTRTVTCNTSTGSWVQSQWSACTGSRVVGDTCGEGYTGNKTRTCTNDVWGNWDSSGCIAFVCPVGTRVIESCGSDASSSIHSRTMLSSGSWSSWTTCN